MTSVPFTEFRNNASNMLNRVEQGERLTVLRHGRPIAEVVPVSSRLDYPSWKQSALRLATKGAGLSAAILEERDDEGVL